MKNEIVGPSDGDSARYAELNTTIKAGLATFLEVGSALAEIKQRRLYRAEYRSWDDYLEKEHGLQRQYASRLIKANEAVSELARLLPIGNKGILPKNESQIRPLHRLRSPEKKSAAWIKAVEAAGGSHPTAENVSRKVDEILLESCTSGMSRTAKEKGGGKNERDGEGGMSGGEPGAPEGVQVKSPRKEVFPATSVSPDPLHLRPLGSPIGTCGAEPRRGAKPALLHDGTEVPDALWDDGYVDAEIAQRKLAEIDEQISARTGLTPGERTALQMLFLSYVFTLNVLHEENPTKGFRTAISKITRETLYNLPLIAAKPGDIVPAAPEDE